MSKPKPKPHPNELVFHTFTETELDEFKRFVEANLTLVKEKERTFVPGYDFRDLDNSTDFLETVSGVGEWFWDGEHKVMLPRWLVDLFQGGFSN